jgi:MoaA/NifB/PqqE/SkfB family radical SAM enzyme
MEWHKTVHKLQIDITSHCNAKCGACIRNINGGKTNPNLKLEHFDVDLWKRLCEVDTRGWYIQKLSLNGNWGDAGMHPHLPEMLDCFIQCHPETSVLVSTNGSMQTAEYWSQLATVLQRAYRHEVDFAVDGLGDTHSLYRRNTSFDRLVDNIKTFTQAGGTGNIVMTVFEYNEHQVNDVKDLAQRLGVRRFYTRNSHTKFINIDDTPGYTIIGSDHEPIDVFFDQPANTVMRDEHFYQEFNNIVERNIDKTSSRCPWYQNAEVQIDPWGTVWPCCHISLLGVDNEKHILTNDADNSILDARKQNNLKDYTLSDILSNTWFTGNLRDAVDNAKWRICKQKCKVE